MRLQFKSVLWVGAVVAAVLAAQAPPPAGAPAPGGAAKGGAAKGGGGRGRFVPQMIEGQPLDTRPTNSDTDKPTFPEQTRAPYHKTAAPVVTKLVDKLNNPWTFRFLPDGNILITEKPGAMRILDKQGVLSAPLKGLPEIGYNSQVGLLGLALDPRFATNHRIFFVYSEVNGDNSAMVVARAVLDEAAGALNGSTVIFRSQPGLPKMRQANAGGRLEIGPDGNLYVSIGDRSQSPPWDVAQKLDNDLGKILRLDQDGKPARGNPFIGKQGALPEIYSYGHRNPEGLAFHPDTHQLWTLEFGPRGGDEINAIEPGKNYGWPIIVHGTDYPGPKLTADGKLEKDGIEPARYYWDPTFAPSPLAFYTGTLFPEWKNSVFVGAMGVQFLDRLTLSGDKFVAEEPLMLEERSRVRDIHMGPDGAVYVMTEGAQFNSKDAIGALYKLTPK